MDTVQMEPRSSSYILRDQAEEIAQTIRDHPGSSNVFFPSPAEKAAYIFHHNLIQCIHTSPQGSHKFVMGMLLHWAQHVDNYIQMQTQHNVYDSCCDWQQESPRKLSKTLISDGICCSSLGPKMLLIHWCLPPCGLHGNVCLACC